MLYNPEDFERLSPHNQVYLQSSFDLPRCQELDIIARQTLQEERERFGKCWVWQLP